jgi:hypothetical protein
MILILIYKMLETHQSAAGYPQNPSIEFHDPLSLAVKKIGKGEKNIQ